MLNALNPFFSRTRHFSNGVYLRVIFTGSKLNLDLMDGVAESGNTECGRTGNKSICCLELNPLPPSDAVCKRKKLF